MMVGMGDVTQILSKIEYGDPSAAEQLLPLIYDELRALAAGKMADESPGHTLQATALVHEAYIRLVDVDQAQHWNSRGHFFGAAAEAMRRILVEHVRHKQTLKAGGGLARVDLADVDMSMEVDCDELMALHDAVDELAAEDPVAANVAKLRLFAGMTIEETASILNLPRTTTYRHWTYARAFLQSRIGDTGHSRE
jgi:RNA polymerase sigma factor (TIGR02999 family)